MTTRPDRSGGRSQAKAVFDAEALLRKAKKLGCEQAEVYETGDLATPVGFENNVLKSIDTAETAAVAVRVIKGGRLGFATSSRPGDTDVVEMAVRAAEFGPEAGFDFAAKCPVAGSLKLYDPGVAAWPVDEMLAVGADLVDAAKALEDGVLASALVEKHEAYARVATSAGQDVRMEDTALISYVAAELVEPDNMIQVWRLRVGRNLDLGLADMKGEVERLYRLARRNVPLRGGTYPVLFSPAAAADLVGPVAACLDGKAVVKGESPWRDKLGERVFAEDVTFLDDPALPWGVRTSPFDDEGVPTGSRPVIERGVVQSFFLDLKTARILGRESTGNATRAGPQSAPAPGPSNFVLEPGRTPVARLIEGMKEGLYVDRLMGAWAGNPYSGQVSGNIVLGFKVEKGEVTGRVKDCMLLVNVFEALRDNLLALSREVETTSAAYRLPHILIDKVSVSAKG